MRLLLIALISIPVMALADPPAENVELTKSETASMDSMAELAGVPGVPAAEVSVVPQVERVVSDPAKIVEEANAAAEPLPATGVKVPKLAHQAPWQEGAAELSSAEKSESQELAPRHKPVPETSARAVASSEMQIRVKTIPTTKPNIIARTPR